MHVLKYMLKNHIPLCQETFLNLAYLGDPDKDSIEKLEGEEFCDLPEGFEDWPKFEEPVN